ncbi:MAG: GtrA family protein [Candidatus Manganitrophus sp.]|nr:GtrA family protein [Candidatus Manganitrophus sp.]MDC4223261.1 GtrA family protein [Candidatus Manganitrophus sp.]WDT71637.1 MAG: GtrA family protein [Candidatus Manganitrophus sp.]WDT76113.1 MAG: GtrA family protein [Candidatus Manganitrophus sp.]WDT81015.1 MAG: GtrA family protein [Candidatus Manganitrophus sp.]
MNTMASILTPQLVLFLLAGGIAAAANYGSRFIFSLWARYEFAVVLAYFVGMVVAFVLMRGHVFEARGKALGPQIAKFILINFLAVLQTLTVSVILARWVLPAAGVIENAEAVGHLAGVLVPVLTSYFGHRLLTFR